MKYLDVSPLEKAITQLEESLRYYHADIVQQDPGLVCSYVQRPSRLLGLLMSSQKKC